MQSMSKDFPKNAQIDPFLDVMSSVITSILDVSVKFFDDLFLLITHFFILLFP